MIRYAKYLISTILLALPFTTDAQDLFDLKHSREFAGYMMRSNNFALAAGEWERVLFLSPGDTAARLNLIKAYRLSGNPDEAWQRLVQWHPQGPISAGFALEGIHLSLQQNDFNGFEDILSRSVGISPGRLSDYRLGAWLMQDKWITRQAYPALPSIVATAKDSSLLDLYHRSLLVSQKNPATAVALSILIPGLGKIYSRDWKDGLMTLLFVATNVWQSYRGFSKNGPGSVTGWVFGTLAVGFYTANLFGSWKSAKDYNAHQTDRIKHEAEGLLFSH